MDHPGASSRAQIAKERFFLGHPVFVIFLKTNSCHIGAIFAAMNCVNDLLGIDFTAGMWQNALLVMLKICKK